MRWAAWTGFAAGVWLIIAPFAIGYRAMSTVAATEAVVLGVIIAATALWLAVAANAPQYVDYVLALFGVWSFVAPFALGYRMLETAFYNDMTIGVIVFLAAVVSIYSRSHAGSHTLHPHTA